MFEECLKNDRECIVMKALNFVFLMITGFENVGEWFKTKMDASNHGNSTQFGVYEDTVKGLEDQNRASSASNPVYSLAKAIPPDYELLSQASTLNDPVTTETQNSETLKSSGYEELGAAGPQNPKGYEFVDAIQAGPHEYELVSEIAQTREKKVAPYEGLIKGQYINVLNLRSQFVIFTHLK